MTTTWLTSREAADMFNVTSRRIQKLAGDGRIPGAVKRAGVWVIPAEFSVLPSPKRGRLPQKILTNQDM